MKGEGAAEAFNAMGEQINQESIVKIGQNRENSGIILEMLPGNKGTGAPLDIELNICIVGVKNII